MFLDIYCEICEDYVEKVIPIKYTIEGKNGLRARSLCEVCLEMAPQQIEGMRIVHVGKPLSCEV